MAFALLMEAGSGFAEGSASEPKGHKCAKEGISWTWSGLVLWIEGFSIWSLLNTFIFANAWYHLVYLFYTKWIHFVVSVPAAQWGKQPCEESQVSPFKKHSWCEEKSSCQHVFYWLGLEFPVSINSKRQAELFKWAKEFTMLHNCRVSKRSQFPELNSQSLAWAYLKNN